MPIAAFAGISGTVYKIPISELGAGGGSSSSSSYSSFSGMSGSPVGATSSSSYEGIAGGVAVIGFAAAPGSPVISNFLVDGKSIIDNDYVKASGTLTATVTDETSIDTNLSSVEVDGAYTKFSALTGTSTYSATTGALTYAFSSLASGNHTIGINAVDGDGNNTFLQYTVKVDTTGITATQVLIYPNPFNPNSGTGRIAYNLTNDAATSIYIFNAIGQLVYKQSYAAGAAGGQVGYNEVSWAGKSTSGDLVGNDIYFVRVVSDGKVIGKCKIAILK
ncbi:MAG: T9SS type A sorting domain-containing protein [Candidatus Margulisbacteria bacterium]|nr:T9SS type A sorting domain-containing protein [Candidatus Margulisiibacteriota bacterium]